MYSHDLAKRLLDLPDTNELYFRITERDQRTLEDIRVLEGHYVEKVTIEEENDYFSVVVHASLDGEEILKKE